MCVLITVIEKWGTAKGGEFVECLCAAWNWVVSWLLIWEFSYLLENMALCG